MFDVMNRFVVLLLLPLGLPPALLSPGLVPFFEQLSQKINNLPCVKNALVRISKFQSWLKLICFSLLLFYFLIARPVSVSTTANTSITTTQWIIGLGVDRLIRTLEWIPKGHRHPEPWVPSSTPVLFSCPCIYCQYLLLHYLPTIQYLLVAKRNGQKKTTWLILMKFSITFFDWTQCAVQKQ